MNIYRFVDESQEIDHYYATLKDAKNAAYTEYLRQVAKGDFAHNIRVYKLELPAALSREVLCGILNKGIDKIEKELVWSRR